MFSEEGYPHRTSPNVGEKNIPLFDVALGETSSKGAIETKANQTTDQRDIEAIPESHATSDADIPAESIQQMEAIQLEIHCST